MGQKAVTIKDIAGRLGVSLSTVNKALTGKGGISEQRRKEIIDTAREMGYQVNHVARSLARKPICFGVVFPRFWESFWHDVREGMDAELQQLSSYHVTCEMRYVDSEAETDRAVRELLARKVDALILFMAGYPFGEELCGEISRSKIPVFVSGDEVPELNACCTIGVNGHLAGNMAADVMSLALPRGAKVAVLIGSETITVHARKAAAFLTAMEAAGCCPLGVFETRDDEQQVEHCMARLMEEHPDVGGIYVASATGGPVLAHCAKLPAAQRPMIVTTDVYEAVERAVESGLAAATIYQNQELMGRLSVRVAYEHLCSRNGYCMEQPQTVSRVDVNPKLVFRSGIGADAIPDYRADGLLQMAVCRD